MFRKVLIANRGEIAVRIIRALREMGILSVAVYSEPDRSALHVRMADEAWPIGPAASAESYLVIDRIIEACKQSGAEAVHPGYGFLSENAAFAKACTDAGVVFIGPPAEAMTAMGNKTAARARMLAAKVPVVPGADADSFEGLAKAAGELGYPVMLKAASGGGGKGMRLVHRKEDLEGAYARAQSEARSSFGDDTVYVEKAIENPRHIEIQILADSHGNVVHLFERDCSIQRRHQKVLEETPSPFEEVTEARVAEMGEVAIRAAKAVNYRSAGTVEFLMAPNGDFYFLEMNTRLQVEHPITELITGVDLVRQQVRIAAGQALDLKQAQIQRRGHAIECRIYAEDPSSGFMPSPGRIDRLREPSGPGIRNDSCAYEGCRIESFYDPLISKLCVWAATREEAICRMRRALSEYVVTGIRTNLPFHLALTENDDFVAGHYDTGFISSHEDQLLTSGNAGNATTALLIGTAVSRAIEEEKGSGSNGTGGSHEGGERSLSAWRRRGLPRSR